MEKRIIFCAIMVLIANVMLIGADLVMTENANGFINGMTLKTYERSADIAATSIQEPDEAIQLPLSYEVVKMQKSDKTIKTLSKVVEKYGNRVASVGFDAKNGIYFYKENNVLPLANTGDEATLKARASQVLSELLGKEASRFIFANTEEDTFVTKDNDIPVLETKYFRFVRKINGRFVADNTAYVKIAFSGAQKLTGFEISNPELKPFKLDKLVKLDATYSRLKTYANNKESVRASDGREVGVTIITAEKGANTYYSETRGSRTFIIPFVSFWSTFSLDNGDSFGRFINLSLDGTNVSDIEPEQIENMVR